MAREAITTVKDGRVVNKTRPALKREAVSPNLAGLRQVKIDNRTILFTKNFTDNESEIISEYNRKRTSPHSGNIGATNGGNGKRKSEAVSVNDPEDNWND